MFGEISEISTFQSSLEFSQIYTMYTYNDALELILSTQGNWLFVGPEVYQDFTKFEFTEGFLFLRDLLDAQIREAQLDRGWS